MAFFGLRKWPTPVWRPMAPFIAASGITFYLVSTMQELGVRSEAYAKDPKNPYAPQIAREAHH
ncbi:ATPase, F0 complex, subunit J [Scleroderma yunnanense]